MQKIVRAFCYVVFLCLPVLSYGIISLELTKGVAGAIPIAITSFASNDNLTPIISHDLQMSGRFKIITGNAITQKPASIADLNLNYFRKLGVNDVAVGRLTHTAKQNELHFQLLDVFSGKEKASILIDKKYNFADKDIRAVAHRISDIIYQTLMGMRGIFSTKLAYIAIKSQNNRSIYTLEVADADGQNPQVLLQSYEPIMSPSWSADGKKIAYVSFEKRRASIFIQDIATGKRQLISAYPGINGAPAWSPDGKYLALVLSKTGSPNIYLKNLTNGKLTALTQDFYINTEPAFSRDGRSLLFTSNRSGGPQIYQMNLSTKQIKRLTYDGNYNARAAYTADGRAIAMIHQVNGIYNIGLLDLDSGRIRVLTHASVDSTSPSMAPNGSMVLYDTMLGKRSILAMVSSDAKVQMVLPAGEGDAQDPAWSPYLS